MNSILPLRPAALFALCVCSLAPAQEPQSQESRDSAGLSGESSGSATATAVLEDGIAGALEASSEDVRAYNDHVVFLASPFLDGRLPGTRGMEIATEYVEHYLEKAGLQPAFEGPKEPGSADLAPRSSYRQPFALGSKKSLVRQTLALADGTVFEPGVDFAASGLGGSGKVRGPLVFVGYGVDDGPDGYSNFEEGDDLAGKIAVLFRFEPMDENGKSRFEEGRWGRWAGFARKIRTVRERNPAAIVIINPPGADDPRTHELPTIEEGSTRAQVDYPVLMMSIAGGEKLARVADPEGRSLMELRTYADGGGKSVALKGELEIDVELDEEKLYAENVAGILPGKGDLADETILIGAHLDHLGMGYFGSRSGSGELHPGADDNASGSAAILMLAEELTERYAELPEDADARSIVFMCFSAEESGLNGARHYAENPIGALADHALMINFDMIGRIKDGRLSVSGACTGEGMKEWLEPYFEASPLTIVQPESVAPNSDHAAFLSKKVPLLFGIIADFHDDYHTPRDVSSKINRVAAVQTIHLFADILFGAATRAERFAWTDPPQPQRAGRAGAGRGEIKVRFGIAPGNYDGEGDGILVGSVTEGGSAETAGVQAGDVLVKWGDEAVADVAAWMSMLAKHQPGDHVEIVVLREGKEVKLNVKLQAPPTDG